ncbi:GNAT family N-acetyltransferase [Kitasatospora sp. CB02891]|uniref:GNAT family N-acetyltransferase n=1 Tax=Kitasatospora sp. CB02891 TaxID=2020329 RepID=UPI000C2779CD|nr:GNAT family N-acetyltransferase [Kitasatospora sp. CB02891]PJN21412.1 GNAT family N-acetyltransferase [Kitasatospora sp. CB02891]
MIATRIRLLQEDDWDELVALEERSYSASGLSEGREALRSRHRASPSTCFVLEHPGGFGGYLLALPYPLFRCPDLSLAEPGAVPDGDRGSNLHVHDVAITEELRGRGLAGRMMRHVYDVASAAGHRTVSVVAVLGAQAVWGPLGFRARPEIGLPASYGAEAVYMVKPLEPAAAGSTPGSLTGAGPG